MKKFLSVCLLCLVAFSCNNSNNFLSDPGGSAKYLVTNTTSTNIQVEYKVVIQLGSYEAQETVLPGETKEIFSDFQIGINPMPTYTFEKMNIYDLDSLLLLSLEPMTNAEWRIEKMFTGDFGQTNYYLEI